jgi:LmbE family N-acetylglucosaminyl deacetylase
MQGMRLLAIGAHPDDIEFGCAGILAQYSKKGNDVHLLVVADGGMAGDPKVRMKEQEISAEIMGAKELLWGGYKDTLIVFDKPLIDLLEGFLRNVNPSLVLVNYPDDTHQDHVRLANAAVSATRYTPKVIFYETPTSIGFNPLIFADIEETLEKKVKCLEAHASQFHKTHIPGSNIVDIAIATARFRGTQARVTLAEGFAPLRYFLP